METPFDINHASNLEQISNGSVVATCSADIQADADEIMVRKDTINEIPSISQSIKDKFQQLFLGTRQDILLIPAQHNPNVRTTSVEEDPKEVFTYATLEAAKDFAGILNQVEGSIKNIDFLLKVNGAGNLITFGSPTSNLIIRTAMRYFKLGDDNVSGFKSEPTDAFELPYTYALDGYEILTSKLPNNHCIRVVNGKEKKIPNWGIKKADGAYLFPKMNDNGVLLQDYLLISNLPNMFNKKSLNLDERVLNFGGTHREGTQAVIQALNNENFLEELKEAFDAEKFANYPTYWQALFVVDCNPDGTVSLNRMEDFKKVDIHMPALEDLVFKNQLLLHRYK